MTSTDRAALAPQHDAGTTAHGARAEHGAQRIAHALRAQALATLADDQRRADRAAARRRRLTRALSA